MVSVEVVFPAIKRTYEFTLSRDAQIGILIGEMTELIAQTEKFAVMDNAENFVLCDLDQNRVFSANSTLGSYDIKNGAKLMLI